MPFNLGWHGTTGRIGVHTACGYDFNMQSGHSGIVGVTEISQRSITSQRVSKSAVIMVGYTNTAPSKATVQCILGLLACGK